MNCIYCKKEMQKKNKNDGEHVFPNFLFTYFDKEKKDLINYKNGFFSESEGKIQEVCDDCNNGFLSKIDKDSSFVFKEILDYIYEKNNNKIFIFNEEKKSNLLKNLIKTYINRHIYYSKDANGNPLTYKNNDLDYNLYNFFYKYVENEFEISNDELKKYSIYITIDKNKYTKHDGKYYEYQIIDHFLNFKGIYSFKYRIPNIEIIVFYKDNNFTFNKKLQINTLNKLKNLTKLNKKIDFNKIKVSKIHKTKEEIFENHLKSISNFNYCVSSEKKIIVLILDNKSIKNIDFGNKYKINKNYILLENNNQNVLNLINIFKENNINHLNDWKLAISSHKDFLYEEKQYGFDYVYKYIKNSIKEINFC